MTQSVTKFWSVWGGLAMWVCGGVVSCGVMVFMAYNAVLNEMRQNFNEVALRLQRIEIVLRIDPQTKDLPMRTAATEKE